MADFELYQDDDVTPIAIARPRRATWEREQVDRRADGTPRLAKYARVVWDFAPLVESQYQVFIANRPDDGAMTFKTYRQAVGGTPAAFVQCAGIMEPVASGMRRSDGLIHGVQITWLMVEEV